MFKLESYITPILLSYVDKYIKNFRPEDSQVSLWGGDVSFHNLDLRLEVLEQELQLPFSFISGHVHELLIHVPWTKLASEPITITINTIECVLKLRGEDSVGSDSASHASSATNTTKDSRRKVSRRQDVVAPPGYVQSLVNKIVSNITIFCSNLILKYVEEDIVLSVNVKTVTLQSANESWQPAFTDLSPTQIMLRKLISLADLTICLDKRNASGKIEMYQEPLLYRCSMELHLLRSYHNATAKRVSVTRVDIHCGRMDFSLTEQQVPMLMRLVLLGLALHGKELCPEQSPSVEEDIDPMQDSVPMIMSDSTNESWAGWAWSWVPSLLPIYWNEDWSTEHHLAYIGHTYHIGFYFEQASVTLKVTESAPELSYYGPRKVRFIPFIIIQLQGCFVDFVMHGAGRLNVQTGVSRVTVEPYGNCFCGVKEAPASTSSTESKMNKKELVYFAAGSEQKNYMADSLFDPNAVENKGEKKTYNVSWEDHLSIVTEALLLEKSPAIAVDYLYMLELPDDFNSERLSELGSDLEYSNLSEKSLCRVVVGPTAVQVCSGLFHRLQMVQHAARLYDYSPYSTPKPELTREQLPPASAEDFDSLNNNIPKQVFQVTLFKPVINIHLADHPVFDPTVPQASRKHRNTKPLIRQMSHLPKVTLECQCLDARIVKPMYPRRLVITTCQLPAPPQHMFHACHFHINVKLLGMSSHLVLSPGSHTTFLMPSNLAYTQQNLLLTHYWNNRDIPHADQTLRAESLTLTCTKAKLMVISNIIQSQFDPTSAVDIIQNSSLIADAAKHAGVEYLELCVEEMSYQKVTTPSTKAFTLSLGALKAFVLEFPLKHGAVRLHGGVFDEPQQALVLSGPENVTSLETIDQIQTIQQPLLCLTMQCTRDPNSQDHPAVLIFNVRELRACVDPMMWRWLRYAPDYSITSSDLCAPVTSITSSSSSVHRRSRRLSSEASGGFGIEIVPSRRAPTPQESVHSSSDHDQMVAQTGPSLSPVAHSRGTQSESAKRASASTIPEQAKWSKDNVLHWYPVWRGMVLCGDMAQLVIYFPTTSLSAVGAQSIEDALAQCQHSKTSPPPEVLVMTFPFLTLRSAAQKQSLYQYTSGLPVKLPESIWTRDKVSFPWSLSLADLSCYTLQNGTKLHFVKPVSANATVGVSAKYQNDKLALGSLGFCVHVDITPVRISLSQEQVRLMAGLLFGLLEFFSSLHLFSFSSSDTVSAPVLDPPTPASPTVFPESSGSRESPITPLVTEDSNEQQSGLSEHSDAVKITVWMQSTLARLTISLYAVNSSVPKDDLKLTVDMEDIMTSLDLQPVYLKVKCKVAYVRILHYIRKLKSTSWGLGPYVGLVMRRQEDLASSPPHAVHRDVDDGSGFLSVTFTCAKCRSVHSRWGTRKQTTLLANARSCESNAGLQGETSAARYISEIVVKLQPVDFVFSAVALSSFLTVLYPILMLPERKQKTTGATMNWAMHINNSTLPLLYLDTCNIRIFLPASELTAVGDLHDVCLLQVEAISLTPQADNPLGRTVVRSDIYHMAEQTRILYVPGSEVEDRQFQLNVRGFSVNTGTWLELDHCLRMTSSQSRSLRTMSENPALEWNNLVSGKESFTPHMSLIPVIARLNLCIVAAPAIVYHGDVLVCGHSLEVNAVTDIEVLISTGQLLLASALLEEILFLLKPLMVDSSGKKVSAEIQPTAVMKLVSEGSFETDNVGTSYSRFVDSGVDCADASSASFIGRDAGFAGKESSDFKTSRKVAEFDVSRPSIHPKQRPPESQATEVMSKQAVSRKSNSVWATTEHRRPQDVVPVEILLTAGKISFALYELMEGDNSELHFLSGRLKQKLVSRHTYSKYDLNEDVGYEAGSEEGSVEEVLPPRKHIQPLLYILMAQPHAFLSRLSSMRKVQISCFDMSIRSSEQDYVISRGVPRAEDFLSVLLETKGGDPHPDTGIPPAFLTVKWLESAGKASKIDVELGRPTKIYCSIAQWRFIDAVQKKLQHCFYEFIPSPHLQERSSGTQSHVNMKPEVESESFSQHCTCCSENGTDVELPSKEAHESERVSGHERNHSSVLNYQNHSCHPVTIKDEKKHPFRDKIGGVESVSISSQQLVFQLSGMRHEAVMAVSVAGVTGTLSRIVRGQVDRVVGNVAVNCLMLTTALEGLSRSVLNPWSYTMDVCMSWEPWLPNDSSLQVQLTVDSDCILLDVGPEHLHCLHLIWSEYEPFLNAFQTKSVPELVEAVPHPPDQDQHYRDDLRAGAFQFVDAGTGSSQEDLPLPYQVVFWQAPPTMAWRYPQPRALTHVDIFPVPFKIAADSPDQEPKGQVLCSLQYWSDCRTRYLPYAQFELSESEMCHLELPTPPHQVVSCTWRVQLFLQSEEEDELHDSRNVLISPRALAACMRVDSFFAPHQVPCFQAALNISSLQVALYNHVTSSSTSKPLPLSLKQFSVDQLTPESQCFMSFALDNASLYICTWSSGNVSTVELSSHFRCDIIDYAYLTQHCAVESFKAKIQLTVGDTTAISCVTKPIAVTFGPAIGHTLAVSAQLWAQAFRNYEWDVDTPAPAPAEFQVIVSRYVICNDTTRPIRFGQALTDEDILLGSRQCHFYSWRTHRVKEVLRVGVEEGAWVWSQPFSIDVDGLQLCSLADCGMQDVSIVVKVSSLSFTQKQVTLSGQLVVTNLLAEHLECHILPLVDEASGSQGEEGQSLIAVGKSTPPSVLLDANRKVAMRIRFHGLDSIWSGDIPLQEKSRSGQPWLVKVPLHDRGQFLSVWCRVICQHIGQGVKILAMLCPLYMIRSYLPVPAKVLIDTPGLKVHLEAAVNGRGEQQQLYCPGTVDHSHKLTFKLDNGVLPSNPYVPLSYTLIDQRKFLKIDDKDIDIDAIVASLNEVKTPVWPYVGEEYENVAWVATEQPETHVQVKYMPQGPFCSTLLVELQPWALLVNVLGCSLVLMVEDSIVCRVPHQGVITPPKLEHTFNLGLDVDEVVHASQPLQLARPDWGSSFYMPRISGLIPNSGNMQTVIQCGKAVAFLSIASVMVEEMRVITVRAKYIICNYTSLSLQISALAVREFERHPDFLKEEEQSCILTVLPDMENKSNLGFPIVQWAVLGKEEGEGELLPYIMLNSGAGWSCPLRVSDRMVRRSFGIPVTMDGDGQSNNAYTLTVQEHLGQVFLSVYPEIHPQITLHNMCRFKILCAQGMADNDGKAVPETANFDWWCCIEPHSYAHYSLPATSERFPDIVSPGNWPPLVLALSDSCPPREGTLLWSRGVNIVETQEQFVRLPGHGDVKVRVEVRCHTTHVTVETVSHIEISARDIRSRLIHHQEDTEAVALETSHHASLSHSATLYASDYLSASNSSHSEAEQKMKEAESDASFVGADDEKDYFPLDHTMAILQDYKSPSLLTSSLPAVTEHQNSAVEKIPEPCKTKHIHATFFLRGIHVSLTEDIPKMRSERTQIVFLSLDNVCVCVKPQFLREDAEELDVCISIGDLQLDNQMFQHGGYDFPVILIGQVPKHNLGCGFSLSLPPSHLMEQFLSDSLVVVSASLETLNNRGCSCTVMKELKVSFGPLCAYIEDTLITKLTDYLMCLLPTMLMLLPPSSNGVNLPPRTSLVPIPKVTYWDSRQIAFPVRLRTLTVQPLSLLLSVHTSVKLYIALDHSPLHFSAFERRTLITTPYRLGHTLTMHYLSGAIFGAGWMVGSLELLGSPGGFARTLGTGLRDFVSLPYRGIFEGPWGFLVGVTHGSASLMKHVTAGTVSSVTKLAASVARNLDRLTLDHEHLARTEELRRQRPQGVTQGLVQGLTGLGISLLGAVGGIAHHPLQSVVSEGASTRGLVKGVGLGLVGAITKPLSGAAELVALTGQGLLYGAGWTYLPEVRQQSIIEYSFSGASSRLKYSWKLIAELGARCHTLLHVTEATCVTPSGNYEAVALVLTTRALFLVDIEEDLTRRILSLAELSAVEHVSDPTLLCFQFQPAVELEAPSHARVVDFVRRSSGMVADVAHDSAQSEVESSLPGSPVLPEPPDSTDTLLMFYVNPQSRNYFLSVLALAKRQSEGRGFAVL